MSWLAGIAERLRQLVSRYLWAGVVPRLVSRHPVLTAAAGAALAAATAVSLTLALTAGGPPPAPDRSVAAATVAPTRTATPTATPRPTPTGPLLDPFTGEPVKSLGPVLAVKIDNIVYARPQTGLQDRKSVV